MRTSERAYHQIRWDPRLEPARFTVGVDVHRRQPKRVALLDFVPGGDIPWHRVLFIELEGRLVWDRTGVDDLDRLASEGTALPRPLALEGWQDRTPVRWSGAWNPVSEPPQQAPTDLVVLTWNVLWDRYDPEKLGSDTRWPLLIEALLDSGADLVALQEVTPRFHAGLAAHPRIRDQWWLSHPPGHPDVGDADLLLLGRLGVHQVAIRSLGRHKAMLAASTDAGVILTTHLTSDHSHGAVSIRKDQLEAVARTVAAIPGPMLVLGDFNCPEESDLVELEDVWTALGPPRPTFDPPTNPLARIATRSGKASRLDRIYQRGRHAHTCSLLGHEPVDGVWLSDHAAVKVTLRPMPRENVCELEPTVRSALVWLVEDPEIEAVRETHDPGFARWPAHVSVLWGFVPEHALDEVSALLAPAQTGFETTLEEVLSFEHAKDHSHGLIPSDPEPWQALHGPLRRAFPRCGRAEFRPHLTFARSVDDTHPEVGKVRGTVDRLAVVTRRGTEPCRVRAWVGAGTVAAVPEAIWPLGEPAPAGPLADLPGAVVVGSRALGCAVSGADLDLVWPDRSPQEVRVLLEPHVDEIVAVEKNGLPGFRAWRGSLVVDALPASSDPRAASAIADLAALRDHIAGHETGFRALLRQVKGWARAQALSEPAWAGVEGLAWAVLAARTVAKGGGLRDFFATWGAWDWTRGVGLSEDVGDVTGFTVLTPSDGRPITERADRDRVEGALISAWQALEDGAEPDDLLRPFSFHRRFSTALEIRPIDRISLGYARGRGCALIAATGAIPCPGNPLVLGVHEPEQALEAADSWAAALPGVEVALVPTARIPSPPSFTNGRSTV